MDIDSVAKVVEFGFDALPRWAEALAIVVGGAVTTAAAAATALPDKLSKSVTNKLGKAAPIVNGLLKALNYVAFNFGKAKNAK